eukprot:scaffold193803_cov32-Tisochrysis_lutea.AAC.2
MPARFTEYVQRNDARPLGMTDTERRDDAPRAEEVMFCASVEVMKLSTASCATPGHKTPASSRRTTSNEATSPAMEALSPLPLTVQ